MEKHPPYILEAGGSEVRTEAGGARCYRKPLKGFHSDEIKNLLLASLSEWSRHKDSRLGAALAFYTLLSMTPMLLVAISLGGLVVGRSVAESDMVRQIQDLVGPQGAAGIRALLSG